VSRGLGWWATFIAIGERMDFLVNVAQIVAFSVPIAVLGAWVTSRGSVGMRGLVGPWRDDPWPMGVQEEDPDAPWGHDAKSRSDAGSAASAPPAIEDLPADAPSVVRPDVMRLHGSVHRPH
jgi:hypothetical protein